MPRKSFLSIMGVMQLWRTLSHLFHPQRSNNHRPRVLHPEALAYLCVIAFGFAALLHALPTLWHSSGSILGYASDISVEQVVALTNQERARSGLEPLTLNDQLSQAALSKGQDMLTHQYWAHTSPTGKEPWSFISASGYSYRVAGENLARDFMHSTDMISAWMASPTHRANIMNDSYHDIGIAVIDGELEGVETTLVVQMFGTLRPSPVSPATTQQAAQIDRSLTFASVAQATDEQTTASTAAQAAPLQPPVLAGVVLPAEVLSSPLISPQQLMKAFFLAVVLLIIATLSYDLVISDSRKSVRLVGKNLAHLMLFGMVAFLLIFFKGGVVG